MIASCLETRDVVSLALAFSLAGCEDMRVHLFAGQLYDKDADCLEASEVLDVIEGEGPDDCGTSRCFLSPSGELYVSLSCDAPADYTLLARDNDETCALALDALEGEKRCP